MNKNKWFLNGGRGSVKSFRLLCEAYENKIAELKRKNTELEKSCDKTQELLDKQIEATYKVDKENAELRKIAEFQQSSNMGRHFENKRLKEGLAVGSILNKGLNSLNKVLEEERDKYRNMVFDLQKENAELKRNTKRN